MTLQTSALQIKPNRLLNPKPVTPTSERFRVGLIPRSSVITRILFGRLDRLSNKAKISSAEDCAWVRLFFSNQTKSPSSSA